MKILALTQSLFKHEQYNEIRDALDVRWTEFVTELNCLPLVLPTCSDPVHFLDSFELDGIILTGGNDLASVRGDRLSIIRDRFEQKIIELALSRDIPLLGVCRGMQIIAHHFGGTLVEVREHAAVRHGLQVSQSSIFSAQLTKLGQVNSYHRYAVDALPDGFALSATCADGVIEAFEHRTRPIFCQMWHPERESPLSPSQLDLASVLFRKRR